MLILLLAFYTVNLAQDAGGNTYGGVMNEQGIHFDLTEDHGFILVGNTQSMGAGSNGKNISDISTVIRDFV